MVVSPNIHLKTGCLEYQLEFSQIFLVILGMITLMLFFCLQIWIGGWTDCSWLPKNKQNIALFFWAFLQWVWQPGTGQRRLQKTLHQKAPLCENLRTNTKKSQLPKIIPKNYPGNIPATTKNTLPETNIAPEDGWLEDNPFLLGPGPAYVQGRTCCLFRGVFAAQKKSPRKLKMGQTVSFREFLLPQKISPPKKNSKTAPKKIWGFFAPPFCHRLISLRKCQ